jgi:transposase-like protein
VALGVNLDGNKEILGFWVAKEEGAKFWLKVVTELKSRGLKDMFIGGEGYLGIHRIKHRERSSVP